MLTNEGLRDRIIRIAAGIIILMFLPRTTWALVGLVPLLTGLAGYCPLYHVLGWSTSRAKKAA